MPIIGSRVLQLHPELRTVLDALAGKTTTADMRRLNYAIEGQHRDVRQVVHQFLLEKHLIGPAASPAPPASRSH